MSPGVDIIERRTLHGELVARLRDLINEGDLPPGQRITEKDLCLRFGVSRTPLREALKVLASEGLVELLPNRGARVAQLTPADVDEIFPVMAQLEALAGELACRNATDEEIAEIRALHYQMLLHYQRRALQPYFALNQEIHEKLLEAARNATLANLSRSLSGRVRRARYIADMTEEAWAQAVAEHETMLAALIARDGPRLAEVSRQHVVTKAETVRASLLRENEAREREPA
ncbi:MAG: GntR family transcriptional regulator [Kiloniellales bacterium]|nr:GntR family transcriptional regulator [Kiloniellales bacterium]